MNVSKTVIEFTNLITKGEIFFNYSCYMFKTSLNMVYNTRTYIKCVLTTSIASMLTESVKIIKTEFG